MKYLGWITAGMLLIVCIFSQLTINNYKKIAELDQITIKIYQEIIAVYEDMHK